MKKYLQRGLALILCVVMSFSCMVVPAQALIAEMAAGAVLSWCISVGFDEAKDLIADIKSKLDTSEVPFLVSRSTINDSDLREVKTADWLLMFSLDWQVNYAEENDLTVDIVELTTDKNEKFNAIRFSVPHKRSSGKLTYKYRYVATPDGKIICSTASADTLGQWLDFNEVKDGSRYFMLEYADLYNLATNVGGEVQPSGNYYIISKGGQVYVNLSGLRFAAFAAPTASNTNLPAGLIENENGTFSIDYQALADEISRRLKVPAAEVTARIPQEDIDEAVRSGRNETIKLLKEALKGLNTGDEVDFETICENVWLFLQEKGVTGVTNVNINFGEGAIEFNGQKFEMGDVTYNPETKTYTITTNNTTNNNTNNETNNTTNNETHYFITNYHINYTSITYIGATEEYNKYFKVYYQLPDGRSSADLTAEELEQLNVDMDVIPYGRSTETPSIRALYHFDGDTKDASYWNHQSTFEWEKGASLTYMEAGDFGGALYLDEKEHKFSAYLPSNIASNDFTIQFRYYQSKTLAPVRDSYVGLGGNIVLRMDGASLYIGNDVIHELPIGTWNEIAIIRKNKVRMIYLNGICVYRGSDSKAYTNRLVFNFGSDQQTYKYLDEIRVLDFALAGGENYTPTSAPHDSNLTLVLPDSVVPVADAYWKIESSKKNLIPDKYAYLSAVTSESFNESVKVDNRNMYYYVRIDEDSAFPTWNILPHHTNLISNGQAIQLNKGTGLSSYQTGFYGDYLSTVGFSLSPSIYSFISQNEYNDEGRHISSYFDAWEDSATEFVFSIVNSDGKVASVYLDDYSHQTATAFGYEFGLFELELPSERTDEVWNYYHKVTVLAIVPVTNNPDYLVYMELVNGELTDLSAEWVEGVTIMDKDKILASTLAVQTDLDITSFQIGGVRPSLPKRGNVYAMVESGYIISLQIYDGSGWVEVDGRIWTGSRWIPYRSYNVITLQDMFDIVDSSDMEHIQTESGFYDWIQRTFKQILTKMDTIIEKLTNIGGGSPDKLPDYEDKEIVYDEDGNPVVDDDGNPVVKDNGWKAVDLFIVIKDGVWSVVTGVVRTGFNGLVGLADGLSHVTTFYNSYSPDSSSGINSMYTYGGDDIWD